MHAFDIWCIDEGFDLGQRLGQFRDAGWIQLEHDPRLGLPVFPTLVVIGPQAGPDHIQAGAQQPIGIQAVDSIQGRQHGLLVGVVLFRCCGLRIEAAFE